MRHAASHRLSLQADACQSLSMRALFQADPQRFQKYSLQLPDFLMDFSKHRISDGAFEALVAFGEACELPEAFRRLFQGEIVNPTDNTPALHPAIRNPLLIAKNHPALHQEIKDAEANLARWVNRATEGQLIGYTQRRIEDIVHIGMGGSLLGTQLAVEALQAFHQSPIRIHFISHLDPLPMQTLLSSLSPETTFFSIASKSFTTEETLVNLKRAQNWLPEAAWAKQTLAITAEPARANAFGITQILPMWAGLGGRYSVWSGVSFPLAMAIGMEHFRAFLKGGAKTDAHVQTAPIERNGPMILALIDFWYHHYFQVQTQAILPYSYALRSLPHHLQQLHMESLGKSVTTHNTPCTLSTGGILFGETGTNGQHSFYQLLQQGQHLVPIDFITLLPSDLSTALFQHCVTQSYSLMWGRTADEIKAEYLKQGLPLGQVEDRAKREALPGNQPSTTLVLSALTPDTLGQLLAWYEHKVFAYATLCEINPFDQPGVEFGKRLIDIHHHDDRDSSTKGILAYYQQLTEISHVPSPSSN